MARLKPAEALFKFRSQMTGDPFRKKMAEFARGVIREADNKNAKAVGRPVDHTTYVDGRKNAPLESVKPNGVIYAVWALHVVAIDYTWETLARLSPIDVSDDADDIVYRNSHRLMVNGAEVAPGIEIHASDVVQFTNLLAYARKIERGWSKRQAPDGVYEAASRIVKARFGNVIDVKFSYGKFSGSGADVNTFYPQITLREKRNS